MPKSAEADTIAGSRAAAPAVDMLSVTKPIPCRVCGEEFIPRQRSDAVTCSNRCRQRLRRGHDLEYLAELEPELQQAARTLQDATARARAARREARATQQARRAADAKLKLERLQIQIRAEVRSELELERLRADLIANAPSPAKAARMQRRHDGSIAAVLKHLGPDATAEAIAKLVQRDPEDVRQSLERLRACTARGEKSGLVRPGPGRSDAPARLLRGRRGLVRRSSVEFLWQLAKLAGEDSQSCW